MRRPHRTLLASWCAAAALGGCGGGFVYIGWGAPFDLPPGVSLTADVRSAAPGETVRFSAAATDDFEVVAVSLLRIEPDGRRSVVEIDADWPWTFDSALPADARESVRYFARAEDDAGQTGDSNVVEIAVR